MNNWINAHHYVFYDLIFYLVLFIVCKYFFKHIGPGNAVKTGGHDEKYLKHDLLIAGALYLLCTIVWFYPCLQTISSRLIGPPEDNMQHLWNMWWFHKVFVEHSGSLTFSNYIFYPQGSSLLYNSFSFYNLFLSVLLGHFLASVLVYNLLILHTFLLSGIGAFLLIRYLTKDPYVSLIGGFIFAFNPSHFAHSLHHMELSSIQFIPLFVLYFIKTLKSTSKKNLSLACLFFFLNSICTWNYMIFALFFIGLSYIYLAVRRKRVFLKDIVIKSGIIIGLTFIILSPWLLHMVFLAMKFRGQTIAEGTDYFVADALAFIVPDPYHWLAQLKTVTALNNMFTGDNDWEKTAYLGLVNILIVLATFKEIIKKTAKYFLGLLAGLIISMGASIHILGARFFIKMPYAVITHIPLIANARCPSRFVVYVYLFLAIIVSFAFKHLFNRYAMSGKKKYLLVFIISLLFLDYFSICHTTTKASLPPCYKAINNENKVFGILDLSPEPERATYMMYQTYHGFPIVQGYLSRKIGKSLIDYLELKDLRKQKAQLTQNSVKYIVIHKAKENVDILEKNKLDIQKYEVIYKNIYDDEKNLVLQVY